MSVELNSAAIVRAFTTLGVELFLENESDEISAVVGPTRKIVFTTPRQERELSVYITKSRVTLIVEDQPAVHRAMYGFPIDDSSSFEALVERVKGVPDLIAALKGAAVVDTKFDWQNYG